MYAFSFTFCFFFVCGTERLHSSCAISIEMWCAFCHWIIHAILHRNFRFIVIGICCATVLEQKKVSASACLLLIYNSHTHTNKRNIPSSGTVNEVFISRHFNDNKWLSNCCSFNFCDCNSTTVANTRPVSQSFKCWKMSIIFEMYSFDWCIPWEPCAKHAVCRYLKQSFSYYIFFSPFHIFIIISNIFIYILIDFSF